MSRTIFTFATFVSLKLFPNKSFSKQLQVHFVVFAARALKSTFSPVEPGDQEYLSTFFIFIFILLFFFLIFIFWLHHTACGILVPGTGIESVSLALEAQSLNHWTTVEVPNACLSPVSSCPPHYSTPGSFCLYLSCVLWSWLLCSKESLITIDFLPACLPVVSL